MKKLLLLSLVSLFCISCSQVVSTNQEEIEVHGMKLLILTSQTRSSGISTQIINLTKDSVQIRIAEQLLEQTKITRNSK